MFRCPDDVNTMDNEHVDTEIHENFAKLILDNEIEVGEFLGQQQTQPNV